MRAHSFPEKQTPIGCFSFGEAGMNEFINAEQTGFYTHGICRTLNNDCRNRAEKSRRTFCQSP